MGGAFYQNLVSSIRFTDFSIKTFFSRMVLQHLSYVSNTVEKSLIVQHGLTKKKKKHVI